MKRTCEDGCDVRKVIRTESMEVHVHLKGGLQHLCKEYPSAGMAVGMHDGATIRDLYATVNDKVKLPGLDTLLVFVNEDDISLLDEENTALKNGDRVVFLATIHG